MTAVSLLHATLQSSFEWGGKYVFVMENMDADSGVTMYHVASTPPFERESLVRVLDDESREKANDDFTAADRTALFRHAPFQKAKKWGRRAKFTKEICLITKVEKGTVPHGLEE